MKLNINLKMVMAKSAMVSRFEDFCVFTNKATFGEINKVTEKISNFINSFGADKLAQIMRGEAVQLRPF